MRRQTDHRFVVTHEAKGFASVASAMDDVTKAMRPDAPPEAMPLGAKKRAALIPTTVDGLGESFKLIATTM